MNSLKCVKLLDNVEVIATFDFLATVGLPEKSDVDVWFDVDKFGRRKTSKIEGDVADFIETNWTAKCSKNPRIYDAVKFRLASFECQSKPWEPWVNMCLGITSYKELLGTHYHPQKEALLLESYDACHAIDVEGHEAFRDRGNQETDKFAFMSNCLGVGAITVTSDNFVVLIRRAEWTGEAPGRIDRPGGHPEPDRLLKTDKKDVVTRGYLEPYRCLSRQDIIDEVFDAPKSELRDEINISYEFQAKPLLLGLVRDMVNGGRCALDFLITVKMTRDEVAKRYASGHQAEADESSGLVFVKVADVVSWTLDDKLASEMANHCIAGLRLLHWYACLSGKWKRSN